MITKQFENCANLLEQLRILQFNHDTLLAMLYDKKKETQPVCGDKAASYFGRTA